METEINKAIVKAKTVVKDAKHVLKELEDLKEGIKQSELFNGDEKATFIRFDVQGYHSRRGKPVWGTWQQLLDGNKTKLVVKAGNGFQLTPMRKNQTVDSTKTTANMLFSKDKASVELAYSILDKQADVKYNKEKMHE